MVRVRQQQAQYWILTASESLFNPDNMDVVLGRIVYKTGDLFDGISKNCPVYIKGQKEIGQGGFVHWQFIVYFKNKVSGLHVGRWFPGCHHEPTRSDAAKQYVWKEETRVEGTQFELGSLRNKF